MNDSQAQSAGQQDPAADWKAQLDTWAKELSSIKDDNSTNSVMDLLSLELPTITLTPRPSPPVSQARATHKKLSTSRGKRKKKLNPYQNGKDYLDLRDEINRTRKQLTEAKKESRLTRSQIARLKAKMKEKDTNIERILNFQIDNNKDPSGIITALRNEKLLVKILIKKNEELEAKLRAKESECEETHKKLNEAPSMLMTLEGDLSEARMVLRASESESKEQEELRQLSKRCSKLQRDHDILSTQHIIALKALEAFKHQREEIEKLNSKFSVLSTLREENKRLREAAQATTARQPRRNYFE